MRLLFSVTVGALIAALIATGGGRETTALAFQDTVMPPGSAGPSIIDRFLAREDPPLREYRAVRRMRAANARFRATADLEAMTELAANGTFHYAIRRESGSAYVRDRVLRAVLKDEQTLWRRGDPSRATLTLENYFFAVEPAIELEPFARIAIRPRRRDILLVDGAIIVESETADLRRVEGRLAKNPSFWTNRVEVVRRYDQIDGVRVPVETSSVAHVKLAGRSEFMMTYEYESINGRTVRKDAHPERPPTHGSLEP